MRLAIFDIDGTLIGGTNSERRFFVWLWRRGRIGPRQIAAAGWFMLRWCWRYGRHTGRKNKAYLVGLSTDEVDHEARQFVAQIGDDEFFTSVIDELRNHQRRGDIVVLLSGSLQPIVAAFGRRLGADWAIGTECRIVGDRYTAAPPLRHPFFHDKVSLLPAIRQRHGIAPEEMSAYGDSRFDIPLLAAVGHPVVVGRDPALSRWARVNDCRRIAQSRA